MPSTTLAIPKTTKSCYLSGIVALNIPSTSGTGDWHFDQVFREPSHRTPRAFLMGPDGEFDSVAFLGDAEIFDCSAILDAHHIPHPAGPVFAASHARAIVDLLLFSAVNGKSTEHLELDDWMPRQCDKLEVLSLLSTAEPLLNAAQSQAIDKWCERNGLIGIGTHSS